MLSLLIGALVSAEVVTGSGVVKDELHIVNVCKPSNLVVSNQEVSVDKVPELDLKNSIIEFNFLGVQTKEVVVEPVVEEVEDVVEDEVDEILNSYGVPDGEGICNSAFKTYMGYDAVTCVSSDQYQLLNSEEAYTDEETGLRMYGGRVCIAMGSYYANKIGTKINLVMKNGSVVKCILGDQKSDRHTDPTHRYQAYDGSVAEMIVDYEYFESTEQYPDELDGEIERVEIVK